MSPIYAQKILGDRRFPRVSGDEPSQQTKRDRKAQFSPRERGHVFPA